MLPDARQDAPLTILQELARGGRTGELVCAHGASEVHVYMQAGRVAWGTDTEHPFAFGRYLSEVCGVGCAQLSELVKRCRSEKRALGEALVRSGLATPGEVRQALCHQAGLAVRGLARLARADVAFFERAGFASYARELTFSLDELLYDRTEPGLRAVNLAVAAAASSGPTALIQREVAGCEWAEHWQDASLLDQHGQRRAGGFAPVSLRVQLAEAGVDFLAVRSGAGAILGATFAGESQTVWCGVREDAPFGAAYAVFGRLCGLEHRPSTLMAGASSMPSAPDLTNPVAAAAHGLMNRVPEILGVCHLIGTTASTLLRRRRLGETMEPARLCQFAARVFDPEVLAEPIAQRPCCQELGARSVVLGDADSWTYGVELSAITGESLWLNTSRRVAQGFGWACLTAVVRELEAL